MIPKKIHYCWFGYSDKPKLVRKCISSWKMNCPDYQIIEWNEKTFDINSNEYVRQAYEKKKWAFVSDYVRLFTLVNYGGIYLDSDVEVFRSLDVFLYDKAFTGFEANDAPITAIMGCEAGNTLFKELLDEYKDRKFIIDGQMDLSTNTDAITKTFLNNGVVLNGKRQTICDCVIYPQKTFCPNEFINIFRLYSKETYATHHFMGSWTANVKEERKLHERMRMYGVRYLRDHVGTKQVIRLKGNG